jgi:hypothetical protein
MSSIKHPREKKDASLERDHRVYTWLGDKTFRGLWRKKKRRMAKRLRAQTREELRAVLPEDAAPPGNQWRGLKKTGIVTLAEDLRVSAGEGMKGRFDLFHYCDGKIVR